MKVELISIGDELLIGQTINTNASWLGQKFSEMGVEVVKAHTISDNKQVILDTLNQTVKPGNLVVITGGLGPTKDDVTKHTLCTFFNTELEINEEVLAHVSSFFAKRGRPMLEVNIQQAALPKNAKVLHNSQGTAAGMWFVYHDSIIISLPGVPFEMKGIMEEEAFPLLRQIIKSTPVYYKTILTQGIGESFLAEKMADWENRLRADGLSLAYLPSPSQVKLRISSINGPSSEEIIESYFSELRGALPQHVFGRGEDTLAKIIGEICLKNKLTVSTVESCTAGSLASEIVSVSGSSAYFYGGLITYSNDLKSQLAGVKPETIERYGAVSEQTVIEMSEGGKKVLNTDYCIAVSGVAGPDGGTDFNPVGTVWVAVAGPLRARTIRFQFGYDRKRNMEMSVLSALNILRCEMLGIGKV